jgi:hypothetical protein
VLRRDARFPESARVPCMLMDIAFLHVLAAFGAATAPRCQG